jgi:hypothetical protein
MRSRMTGHRWLKNYGKYENSKLEPTGADSQSMRVAAPARPKRAGPFALPVVLAGVP